MGIDVTDAICVGMKQRETVGQQRPQQFDFASGGFGGFDFGCALWFCHSWFSAHRVGMGNSVAVVSHVRCRMRVAHEGIFWVRRGKGWYLAHGSGVSFEGFCGAVRVGIHGDLVGW